MTIQMMEPAVLVPAVFSLLKRDRQANELEDRLERVSLIVFNYDRCIEHYLFYALKNYYGVSDEESAHILKSLTIHHPYGTVGNLPWEGKGDAVDFGEDLYLSPLIESAERIRTFTEGAEADDAQRIRRDVLDAHRVVFLGFAFHELNIELLRPTDGDREALRDPEPRKYFFATAKRMHKYRRDEAMQSIKSLSAVDQAADPVIDDTSCVDFFDRYASGFSLD